MPAGRVHAADRKDFQPTEAQARAAKKLVDFIDRYGMHTPGIMALELAKPFNRLLSVSCLLAAPSVRILLGTEAVQELGLMLDDRRAVEYLLCSLEERA